MPEPKQLYFSWFNSINSSRSVPGLISKSGVRIIFPFYHVVSNHDLPHIKHLYSYKNVEQFEQDIHFLLKHFKPLHLDDFLKNNYDPNENYFVLSFDDGLREIYDVVFPILKHLAVPAVFFLNSAFVNNKGLFYRYKVALIINELTNSAKRKSILDFLHKNQLSFWNIEKYLLALTYADQNFIDAFAQAAGIDFDAFLQSNAPYLTTEQIQELINAGYTIGSHSVDHPLYTSLSPEMQFLQTAESVHFIASNFHPEHKYFAYPFTAEGIGADVLERIYKELKIDLSFGTAGIKVAKRAGHVERIPMEIKNYSAEYIIKNEYSWFLIKKKIGRK